MSTAASTDFDMDDNATDLSNEFLTVIIAKQRFGIPILQVQDVLGDQTITTIPKAPREVAGALNLRGRVVTAIDLRKRLDITEQGSEPPLTEEKEPPDSPESIEEDSAAEQPLAKKSNITQHKRIMSVVVEHNDELYSLIIDNVGDVLALKQNTREPNPPTLDPVWRDISLGIFRLDNELLVILDVPKLLDTIDTST